VPFARSLAGAVVSLQEPCAMDRLDEKAGGGALELQPFEKGRRSLLAAALAVVPGIHVVIELFDKQGPDGPIAFTDADRGLMSAAADFGAEMLRQALGQQQAHRLLFDAVAAALGASDSLAGALQAGGGPAGEDAPPAAVMDRLREGLSQSPAAPVTADDTLRLVEGVRVLALRHGPQAVQHCIRLVESVRTLLDGVTQGPQ
jgi:hypothetical protein